jgi:hypothetical protein
LETQYLPMNLFRIPTRRTVKAVWLAAGVFRMLQQYCDMCDCEQTLCTRMDIVINSA